MQVRRTDAAGQRLNEAKHINKSLSALGNVIGALAAVITDGILRHIPYRDSKLTRLLQDSLAGNSKTTLILAISCARNSCQETIATLRFGERARQLKTKPRVTIIDSSSDTGSSTQAIEISRLKRALSEAHREIRNLTDIISDMSRQVQVSTMPDMSVSGETLESDQVQSVTQKLEGT